MFQIPQVHGFADLIGHLLCFLCGDSMRAQRDYAMLAMLFGCGFRRSELVSLELDEIQRRQGHWAVVDLIGKGGHIRTVPIPEWVKVALDQWTRAAGVREGRIFRAVARTGKVWGNGHASVQTTERYLGCKQNLGHPVNDLFDLRTDVPPQEKDVECVTVKGSTPVEKASRQGIEYRHGGSEHDQPVCDARPLPLPERTDLVEVRKGPRPHSLRRRSEAGASRGDAGNKADGQSDQRTSGPVGLGTLPDPTS